MNWKDKYIKYKIKYLCLKNQLSENELSKNHKSNLCMSDEISLKGGEGFSNIYVFNKMSNIVEYIQYDNYDEKIHMYINDKQLKKISKNNMKKIFRIIKSQPNYKKKYYHTSVKELEYPIKDNELNNASWLYGNIYKNPIGLWFSCGTSWQKFIGDYPSQWSLASYIYELEFTDSIMHISSINELKKFINTYKKNLSKSMKFTDVINWKLVKKHYDGLIICPYLGNEIWGSNANRFGMWGDKKKINEYIDEIVGLEWTDDLYFTAEWYRHWEEASGVIWKPSTGLKSIRLIKKIDINL